MADEIMSNLPRRRPQRTTERRLKQRQKQATTPRGTIDPPAARMHPSSSKNGQRKDRPATRSTEQQPVSSDLIGQVTGQAVRFATDAADFGLKLASDALRRIAPRSH